MSLFIISYQKKSTGGIKDEAQALDVKRTEDQRCELKVHVGADSHQRSLRVS